MNDDQIEHKAINLLKQCSGLTCNEIYRVTQRMVLLASAYTPFNSEGAEFKAACGEFQAACGE